MKHVFQNLKLNIIFSIFSFNSGANVQAQVTLNLKLYLEAFYASSNTGFMDNYGAGGCLFINGISSNTSDVDTVMISAMAAATLTEVETIPGILKTDGNVSVILTSVNTGSSYFIRVNHRNSIQTWSANPIILNTVTNYDFSSAQTQAYGNNMILTQDGLHWAFYSGDINQDCFIDTIDRGIVEQAVLITLSGYAASDITGDGVAESLDLSNLIVCPNPNFGHLDLMFNSKYNESKEIIIYNFQGKIKFRKNISVFTGKNTIHLELDFIAEGNYLIRLISPNGQSIVNRFSVIK